MKVINKKFRSRLLYDKFVRIMNDILKTYNLDIEKTGILPMNLQNWLTIIFGVTLFVIIVELIMRLIF